MLTRVGGWLFRHRTVIPLPIALALLILPPASSSSNLWCGWAVASRRPRRSCCAWAVRHIGAISRTRSDRLGPLGVTGPFGWSATRSTSATSLWVGLALVRAAAVACAHRSRSCSALEYHAIVRWEERLLDRAARATLSRVHADGAALDSAPPRTSAETPSGAGVQLARDALQRARHAHRDRGRPFALVGEGLVVPAPSSESRVFRLCHRYQHATDR